MATSLVSTGVQFPDSTIQTTAATTGTIPASSGGTGRTTLTANNVILGNGTSAVNFVAPGTNGNVLTSNGTTWTSAAAGGGGSLVFLAEVVASSSSYVTFNSLFTSTYDTYVFIGTDLLSASGGDLFRAECRFAGSYGSGNTASRSLIHSNAFGAGPSAQGSTSSPDMFLTPSGLTNNFVNFIMYAFKPTSTTSFKSFICDVNSNTSADTPNMNTARGAHQYNATTAIDGIRFYYSIGPVQSGVIRMYGIKKS